MKKYYYTELVEKHLHFQNFIQDDNVNEAISFFEDPFQVDMGDQGDKYREICNQLVSEPISKDAKINKALDDYLKLEKNAKLSKDEITKIKFRIFMLTNSDNHGFNVLHIAC